MEKSYSSILNQIKIASPNGETVVVSKNELLSAMPKESEVSINRLKVIVEELKRMNYIEVKFEDEGHFCVCSTEEGRIATQGKTVQQVAGIITVPPSINYKKIGFISGVSAFLGAMLAVAIGLIVASVIGLL